MRETRDLGVTWVQWHTLIFEEQVKGGHESDLPARREKDASEASQDGLLENLGSKARNGGAK